MLGRQHKPEGMGLVLSGGGFRGIAHIGVIKLLEELNISPNYVSGTSAGALVAAFYAAGYSSTEILEFFKNTPLFSLKNYAYRRPGLLNPIKFLPALQPYFPEDNFNSLHKQLFIVRTNLLSGESEIVDKGKLLPSLLASAALPLVFTPVEIEGVLYADGGITNNFPIEPLQAICNKLIGVYVNPLEMKTKDEFKHSYSVMERAFHISLGYSSIPKFSACNVMIVPEELKYHSLIDIDHIQDIFEIGYAAALRQKNEIEQLFE